jgi:hypothetical protein
MAVVITAEVPGGTAEQDDEIQKELNLAGSPAVGTLFRVAGPVPGGWRIMSGWESQDAFETFRRERLAPALQKAGRQMPEFEVWPVHSVRIPQR